MTLNINKTAVTDYSNISATTIDSMNVESVGEQDFTDSYNNRWAQDWAYFNKVAKLRSAIIMKAIWTVGKGYTASIETEIKLEHVIGNGKQTFDDILFTVIVNMLVGGDGFAEIIRDPDTDEIINLRILDPTNIVIRYKRNGMIKEYLQINKNSKDNKTQTISWKPEEMFHLSINRFAGEMRGRGIPEMCEKIILADEENFNVMQKLTRFQAVPFIIFKVKSDNATTIARFKRNIKEAREKGEDLIIPDDENLLNWETVQVSPSAILMEWRNSINNQFYQAVGMPLILFGSAGTTESGGKIEYLGHETVFEFGQRYVEKQIDAQLGFKINLNSPTSLLETLQADEQKDAQNAITLQPQDAQGGRTE